MYASNTRVPPERSRAELDKLLRKSGSGSEDLAAGEVMKTWHLTNIREAKALTYCGVKAAGVDTCWVWKEVTCGRCMGFILTAVKS